MGRDEPVDDGNVRGSTRPIVDTQAHEVPSPNPPFVRG
jgi:hypothetical protein